VLRGEQSELLRNQGDLARPAARAQIAIGDATIT